jgi:hypothetical protein
MQRARGSLKLPHRAGVDLGGLTEASKYACDAHIKDSSDSAQGRVTVPSGVCTKCTKWGTNVEHVQRHVIQIRI